MFLKYLNNDIPDWSMLYSSHVFKPSNMQYRSWELNNFIKKNLKFNFYSIQYKIIIIIKKLKQFNLWD